MFLPFRLIMSYITYEYKGKFIFKENSPLLKIAIYQAKGS